MPEIRTNADALRAGARPCEWWAGSRTEPQGESYLDDEFHGVGHQPRLAPQGRFQGEGVMVCQRCAAAIDRIVVGAIRSWHAPPEDLELGDDCDDSQAVACA